MLYAIYAVDKICGSKSDGWHIDSELVLRGEIDIPPLVSGKNTVLHVLKRDGWISTTVNLYVDIQTDDAWEHPRIEIGSSTTGKPHYLLFPAESE